MSKHIWNRLLYRSKPQPAPASAELETLLRGLNEDSPAHLSCDEAFELIDQYAERAAKGEDIRRLMPLVHEHLERCPHCQDDFNALMRMLESQDN